MVKTRSQRAKKTKQAKTKQPKAKGNKMKKKYSWRHVPPSKHMYSLKNARSY